VLRVFVIIASGLLLVFALAATLMGQTRPAAVALVVWPALVLFAMLFERYRYKSALSAPPGPDWEPTAEKFIDPSTGHALTVYVQPSTGKRAYVRG
jgi:hypothetical protein